MPKSDRVYIAVCLTIAILFAALSLSTVQSPVDGLGVAEHSNETSEWLDGPIVGAPRSPQWPAVRSAHLKLNPACAACGTLEFVEVHHVKSFHEHPELELEPSNLISLCRGAANHHFRIGHDPDFEGPIKANWTKSNPNVRRDAANYRKRHRP